MAGESNRPYRISQTRMTLDSRYATDSAVQSVGRNVVMVSAPRPFANEVRRDYQAPRRIVEPASHASGRSRASTSYVYRTNGINSVFAGLRIDTYRGE